MGDRCSSLEEIALGPAFWRGKRVFITGHTGFKGAWLSLWLQSRGALVHGYALPPPTEPDLFTVADVAAGLAAHTLADVRDSAALKHAMVSASPEFVFHLAAQPLVRRSYHDPVETYAVNVLGTVHLLEAVAAATGRKTVSCPTSFGPSTSAARSTFATPMPPAPGSMSWNPWRVTCSWPSAWLSMASALRAAGISAPRNRTPSRYAGSSTA